MNAKQRQRQLDRIRETNLVNDALRKVAAEREPRFDKRAVEGLPLGPQFGNKGEQHPTEAEKWSLH